METFITKVSAANYSSWEVVVRDPTTHFIIAHSLTQEQAAEIRNQIQRLIDYTQVNHNTSKKILFGIFKKNVV